jgi:hypothetical protein
MPFVDIVSDGLMELTAESKFDFELSNHKIHLSIKPLDAQIKQLYLSVTLQYLPSIPDPVGIKK